MYKFLNKHKFISGVLDWTVYLGVAIVIFSIFQVNDLTTAWFVPIYINLFSLSLFFYVDYCHEPADNRMALVNWLDIIRWINGIGLVLHTTTGYYKKGSYETVVGPVWSQNIAQIVITIGIYLFLIIIPSILIYCIKKNTASKHK